MEKEPRSMLVLGPLDDRYIAAPSSSFGWRCHGARTVQAAEVLLKQNPDIRVGMWSYCADLVDEHVEEFSALRAKHRVVQWIALVPRETLEERRIAGHIAQHFFDFLSVPVEQERLCAFAGHAFGMSVLMERSIVQPELLDHDEQMVGSSELMRQLFRDIRKVAQSDAPVFISGESGTGKELTARAIHERSPRAKGSFVPVDCGAIAPTLIHSELFGYERGAFTGAAQRKIGRMEIAEGGTLFVDEIGDLPLDLQGSLLRFMQESTIQRVGGTRPINVNVRVIAATHVDLEQAVKQGRFRQDLYYRLNVLRLTVPSLRERDGDVEVLARYFLAQFTKDNKKNTRGFTKQALDRIRAHSWPGNIRELINRVRRAIVMCDGDWITPHDLDLDPRAVQIRTTIQLDAARENAERQAISEAIKLCSNNYSAAARMLGVSRPTLYRLLDKHRVEQHRMLSLEAH
jgi:DNA-binding NtrC family response regulator